MLAVVTSYLGVVCIYTKRPFMTTLRLLYREHKMARLPKKLSRIGLNCFEAKFSAYCNTWSLIYEKIAEIRLCKCQKTVSRTYFAVIVAATTAT